MGAAPDWRRGPAPRPARRRLRRAAVKRLTQRGENAATPEAGEQRPGEEDSSSTPRCTWRRRTRALARRRSSGATASASSRLRAPSRGASRWCEGAGTMRRALRHSAALRRCGAASRSSMNHESPAVAHGRGRCGPA
jgi:hypothetical protein